MFMYMDDGWTPFSPEDYKLITDNAAKLVTKFKFNPKTTMAEIRYLPFFNNVKLIRLKDPNWDPKNLFIYLLSLDNNLHNLYWLNGTSPPIHEVNAKAPIRLSEEVALDYLRFFCFFVRSEDGPFVIAEDMEDTYIPKVIDDKTRSVLEGTLRPAFCDGTDENGNFVCDAVVYYSNALFSAEFVINHESGMIKMKDDEPIAADLPVKIDAPIS